MESKDPLQCGTNLREVKSSVETFKEVRTSLNRQTKSRMTEKPVTIFWAIEGNYIYHHHVEPRVKLYVPREDTFPIPLRYIDVIKTCTSDPGCVAGKPNR